MILNEKLYEVLKWICLIVLPAIASWYGAIAHICDLPYALQVTEVITATATLIGCIIGVSSVNFYDKKEKEIEEAKRINGQYK